ncbi:MAG TPA: hypothetical protein VF457_09215 [Burkholderiaceae bacterium]
MMRPADVRHHLQLLNLSPTEAADLLGVGLRSMRRWTAPDAQGEAEPIPGAVEAALRAWLKLQRLGLAWRPDATALATAAPQTLAAHDANAQALQDVLERVRARRGPATQWDVNLERGRATLGKMMVTFYLLRDGGFTPQSFRRSDGLPIDLQRDQALLEDAYTCIHAKLQAHAHAPRVLLALDDPDFSSTWDGVIEMWDMSLSPAVVVTIDSDVVLGASKLTAASDDDLLRFVRQNKQPITEVAEGLLARGIVSDCKIDSQLAPVFRQIELSANDLVPVAARARKILMPETAGAPVSTSGEGP